MGIKLKKNDQNETFITPHHNRTTVVSTHFPK